MINANRPYERAMALAAVCGSKIALGPAFLASRNGNSSRGVWMAAALGEMALDKLGVFPARYRPSLLIPHTLAGAWVARESLKEDGIDDPKAALMGAAVAAGVSCALPLIRMAVNRSIGVPDAMLGVAEDYLALKIGSDATDVALEEMGRLGDNPIDRMSGQIRPVLKSVGLVS